LIEVHERSVYDISDVDDGLGYEHSFEEVMRSSHFCHELDEQLNTGIGQNPGEQAIYGPDEVRCRKACIGNYRRIVAVGVSSDSRRVDRTWAC
jgi:hypothetical protein